jgi:hypothetical protein
MAAQPTSPNGSAPQSQPAPDPWQREILPIPDPPYAGTIVYDAKNPEAKFPPIRPLRRPAGAPNVLIVLLDDVGFGATPPSPEPSRRSSWSGAPTVTII